MSDGFSRVHSLLYSSAVRHDHSLFHRFINLTILAIMAVACAVVDSELEKDYYPKGAPWLYSDNKKDNNPSINGLVTWAFALITSLSPDHFT
jgi:hypothetical protein